MKNSSEHEGRLTKRQRVEQKRAENKAQLAQQIARGRQRFMLKLASLGLVIATGLGAVVYTAKSFETSNSPTTIATSIDSQDKSAHADVLLQQEIKKQGINRSQQEVDLWDKGYKFPLVRDFSGDLSPRVEEGAKRMDQIIHLMSQSKNPKFKEAGDFLVKLLENDEVGYILSNKKSNEGFMGTSQKIVNDKIVHTLSISIEDMLSTHPIELAVAIAHETVHVKKAYEFNQSLPQNTGSETRLRLIDERMEDLELEENEEYIAYGNQAAAYIHQRGLMGLKINTNVPYGNLAYYYLLYGANTDNAEWKKHIKNNALSLYRH